LWLQYLGAAIYLAVIGCVLSGVVIYKTIEGKAWEHISVRNAIYMIKGAMLLGGRTGPLLYFCLFLQIYNFSLIINHRNDSKPGGSFPLHCYFIYFTMIQYFIRSNHRERFDSIQFGKVCPGGIYCGETLHWILIIFEITAPFIISMMLFPLVVKARIRHAYAFSKKNEYATVETEDESGPGNGNSTAKRLK